MPLPISTTDMAPEQADTTLTCEELLLLADGAIFLIPSPVLRWTHSGINGLAWQGQLGPRSCRKNTAWVPMHAEISKTMLRVLFGLVLAKDVSRLEPHLHKMPNLLSFRLCVGTFGVMAPFAI